MAEHWSRALPLVSMAALLLACDKDPPSGPTLAPNAPPDRPVVAEGKSEIEAHRAAIAPYVEKARQTWPGAKKRYLEGLPAGHVFFVTTRLADGTGAREDVFITVSTIKDGRISGQIASDVLGVKGYKRGDSYELPETELIDWLISRPDGTEEGNVVGKFLDEWQKTKRRP